MQPQSDFTQLLAQARTGDAEAHAAVFSVVYDELRALAGQIDARRSGHTLQPTAIVHEAWLKLAYNLGGVSGRVHFFAVASMAMRQVIADYARTRNRAKRGNAWSAITLDENVPSLEASTDDLVALHDCLEQLAALHARHARVVELRVFGGLTIDEAAEVLGVSHSTIESDWSMARAWLSHRLAQAP
jgi:RNA polymerase sigma factor (TIGR02999 family)